MLQLFWPPGVEGRQHAPVLQGGMAQNAAYAYGAFHEEFMKDRITLIGCPKLDGVDYSVKLTEILKHNEIQSICLVRMEVPCCGGLEYAVRKALENSGKQIPWKVKILSTEGKITEA